MNTMPENTVNIEDISILLIDDDDVDYMTIKRAMKTLSLPCSIVRARDGLEALTLLREPGRIQSPYIILLDINMPRMNGFETLEALRADPKLAQAVVFMLTTSNSKEDRLNAYRYNVAGFIQKGCAKEDITQMLTMLHQYMEIVSLPPRS